MVQGVKNVAQIAKERGQHVVMVSSALVTPKNRFNPIRLLLNNIRWGLMDAKVILISIRQALTI
jgi:hypothetical protein